MGVSTFVPKGDWKCDSQRAGFAKNIEWYLTVSSQLIFYLVLGVVLGAALYRYVRRRSVPRVSPAEADRMIHSGQALFLDVRTDSEQRSEHIKGALLIPLHTLRRRAEELKKHSNREIICYCRNGNRSLSAAAILRRRGLRASSLEGGIGEWNYYQHTQE
jgi:rhodanese-related sulfurtransferase